MVFSSRLYIQYYAHNTEYNKRFFYRGFHGRDDAVPLSARAETFTIRRNATGGTTMTVQHVVLLEFKDGVSEDQKMDALGSVEDLKNHIDGIERIVSGKDFSGRAGNFTHSVIVQMRDRDVLAAYGPHPAHKAVQEILGPIVETLWVVDFEPA
jgi:hypothetical protein